MTKTKSTKRMLLGSALALLVCVSMLVGSTFAWFTDNVTSTGNQIQAGNLDVVLEMKNENNEWHNAEGLTLDWITQDDVENVLWEPGCRYKLPTLRIRNAGSLAIKYQVQITGFEGDVELLNALEFTGIPVQNVDESLLPGVSNEFTIEGHMPASVGNEVQGLELSGISITVVATQLASESDSFNNSYDANATQPQVTNGIYAGGETISTNEVSVTLPPQAEKDSYSLKIDNKRIDTDANGETTLTLNIDLLKNGVEINTVAGINYEVKINVGKNLEISDVKHNGASVTGIKYDTVTGIVSFNTDSFSPFAVVYKALTAKVGNNTYYTIDDAVNNWNNNTTLTLLRDVTLSDAIILKSTEHHVLNLGTYTMTAASNKHAIEITCEGRSSASYALTVNADATNPGGIVAKGKSCIYYKKSGSTKDRPIILINNGVFTGSYALNITSNGNTNCPQIWINGGIFNNYINLTKCMLRVSGGTFHGTINCTGDSSAYREFKGGRFKSWQFMTADAPNKFWVGSGNGNYNVGVYVDAEGYLVVGGPVITELSEKYPAVASNYSKWSSYLKYSSAATYGLFYEDADMAIKKHGESNVTLY